MRCCTPYRPRSIRAVDAVAFKIEAHPPRADRIVLSRGNHRSMVIVGRVGDSAGNRALTGGTGTHVGTNRDLKRGDYNAVVDDGELAVHKADQHHALADTLVGIRTLC